MIFYVRKPNFKSPSDTELLRNFRGSRTLKSPGNEGFFKDLRMTFVIFHKNYLRIGKGQLPSPAWTLTSLSLMPLASWLKPPEIGEKASLRSQLSMVAEFASRQLLGCTLASFGQQPRSSGETSPCKLCGPPTFRLMEAWTPPQACIPSKNHNH